MYIPGSDSTSIQPCHEDPPCQSLLQYAEFVEDSAFTASQTKCLYCKRDPLGIVFPPIKDILYIRTT